MAFTCGFFNSVNHDRKYDAVQHGMVFDGIITDGIYATYLKAMVVKASSNPSEVIVQPGRAWFNHTWSYNDADYPVAAPDPEVVLDRIDTLVLDVNNEDAVRNCQFLWVQGTPTSQVPEAPELIRTATHNQYPLCDVYRQAGTTQIYAADITNRVGTSDCPFVTGVLEGINIDDLLAQWDDEFHTWENATKASFEGWMLNQQAVYTAWWDALKTQMAGDVDDVEEWIQTIKDIIDEETATHLQLEIDEINSMLPAGSHITVTTTDTELYSRAVTITDEDDNTLTSQFDATGVAVFKSVPYVGNLTIEATDGIRTATAVVNTPYFARYEFSLAFWSATVNITGDTELGGETVTITDSSQILVGTVVLDASGAGVFNATYPDTYKFSVTHGGQTMEVSLAVTQETTYNVTIHAGFNWRGWVDTAQYLDSSDYNSLDEVLADELAVRELCLEHACVDYLAAVPSVNADIETIINNDLFAKWVNNSDYSLDVLGANVAIKALMDTADKYGYGEWTLVGQVPTMTSNTAPYGEAFGNLEDSNTPAWKAFDNSISTYFRGKSGEIAYVGYTFTEPKVVKSVYVYWDSHYCDRAVKVKVQGSNDSFNSDIHDLSEFVSTNVAAASVADAFGDTTIDINSDVPYTSYRIITDVPGFISSHGSLDIYTLQFYAYAPKGNVPVMTANNAPYGEAFGSNVISGREWYKAFDGTSYSVANLNVSSGDSQIGYKSTNPINVKRVFVRFCSTASGTFNTSLFIEGSNDNSNWEILKEISTTYNTYSGGYTEEDIAINNNDDYYLYHRVRLSNSHEPAYSDIQFYGRELTSLVPPMTSNTTPYGEASASSYVSATATFDAWKAFDGNKGNDTTGQGWEPTYNSSNPWIMYKFPHKVKLNGLAIYLRAYQTSGSRTFKLEGSDDGETFESIIESFTISGLSTTTTYNLVSKYIGDFVTNKAYTYYKLTCIGIMAQSASTNIVMVKELEFYGKDYSEKEFEEGTTKKWLYDHGVELETLNSYRGIISKDNNDVSVANNGDTAGTVGCELDTTSYNLLRAKIENFLNYAVLYGGTTGLSITAYTVATSNNTPNTIAVDVSSLNQNSSVGVQVQYYNSANSNVRLKELWLE